MRHRLAERRLSVFLAAAVKVLIADLAAPEDERERLLPADPALAVGPQPARLR